MQPETALDALRSAGVVGAVVQVAPALFLLRVLTRHERVLNLLTEAEVKRANQERVRDLERRRKASSAASFRPLSWLFRTLVYDSGNSKADGDATAAEAQTAAAHKRGTVALPAAPPVAVATWRLHALASGLRIGACVLESVVPGGRTQLRGVALLLVREGAALATSLLVQEEAARVTQAVYQAHELLRDPALLPAVRTALTDGRVTGSVVRLAVPAAVVSVAAVRGALWADENIRRSESAPVAPTEISRYLLSYALCLDSIAILPQLNAFRYYDTIVGDEEEKEEGKAPKLFVGPSYAFASLAYPVAVGFQTGAAVLDALGSVALRGESPVSRYEAALMHLSRSPVPRSVIGPLVVAATGLRAVIVSQFFA